MSRVQLPKLSASAQAILISAVLSGFHAPAVAAQQMKYAGTTATTFDGSQGYFAPHQDCARKFRGSVWCTSEMIIEGGPHLFAESVPEEGAWVNPAVVGGESGTLVDFSGVDRGWPFLNCTRWTIGGEGEGRGLVIEPGPGGPTFEAESCGESRPAACCSEIGPRPAAGPARQGFGPLP